MPESHTRFDLRVPSARTGRLVLPAMNKRRVCACCEASVVNGWVLSNGDSVCGHCEDTITRAEHFHGSLDAFTLHLQRIGQAQINAPARQYLAAKFRWA